MNNIILKIDNFIRKMLPYDKTLHFIAGCIIISAASTIAICLGIGCLDAMAVGLAVTLLAGVSKELFDVCIKHEKADCKDIVFTAVGAMPVCIVECAILFFM